MKDAKGKRLFSAALILCLVMICALCWSGGQNTDAAGASSMLENASLSMRVDEDGAIWIDGEGMLSVADMNALLNANQVKSHQVNDMILADGITGLGFNAINGMTYLETLKLGSGMAVVENGAVKNCTALKYVFVPAGIERLGRDFLYRSVDAFVVTDGDAREMPKMKQVPADQVLDGIDSFETLVQRRGELDLEEVPEACRRWWQ